MDGLERNFHYAVDNYLALCVEIGKEPEKSKTETES